THSIGHYEKEHIDFKNRPLVVYRSIKNAVIGIIIPLTSIKIDCSHWTVFSDKFKSSMIGGNAVPKSVWFKMATNAPEIKTIIRGTRLMLCFCSGLACSSTIFILLSIVKNNALISIPSLAHI